jgi:integrase
MTRSNTVASLATLPGLTDAWIDLLDAWPTDAETVALWICPTSTTGAKAGGGAYIKIDRYLKALSAELELPGKAHTQRFRRTVGVRALEATASLEAAQHALGHTTTTATTHYTGEVRRRARRALEQKLQETHGHQEEETREDP